MRGFNVFDAGLHTLYNGHFFVDRRRGIQVTLVL